MGHDITASYNHEKVAYNRRGAGNPLNQVLYLALGIVDDAYGGCSGKGVSIKITLDQFKDAEKVIKAKSFSGMARERNLVDDVIDAFKASGISVSESDECNDDVSQESEFIEKCIGFMELNEVAELDVAFY